LKPDQRRMRIYPAISKLDVEEYDRIRNAVIAVLKKRGLYEPDIDELIICEIASNVIYSRKVEAFLDADSATEYTYSRMIDAKLKLEKAIEAELRELALSRRERLDQQGQGEFWSQLRETILKSKAKGENK